MEAHAQDIFYLIATVTPILLTLYKMSKDNKKDLDQRFKDMEARMDKRFDSLEERMARIEQNH